VIHVILYEPEIPQNTGNIIRLCANSGARLHLIRPLGFTLDDARLRRAGLDYHEYADLTVYDSLDGLRAVIPQARWLAFTTSGSSRYDQWQYQEGDALLFGPETRGLPRDLLDTLPAERRFYLPQRPGIRSLNLANAVAVAAYEAWRQLGFKGSRIPL
jgi:tRNA (cytidine/uridine-2'-O-)-methyltransferase